MKILRVCLLLFFLALPGWAKAETGQPKLQFPGQGFSIAPLEGTGKEHDAPSHMALTMFLPVSEEFAPNVTVIIQNYSGTMLAYAELSERQFQQSDFTAARVRFTPTSAAWEGTGADHIHRYHWYTRAERGNGKMYLITATATETQWVAWGDDLRACVDSFENAGCAATADFAAIVPGARVAVPWGGTGGMYLGTVQSVAGATAKVLYADDNTTHDVEVAKLVPVIMRTWQANDRVLAVWGSGKFYPGVIAAVLPDNTYTVNWEDGSNPSNVVADRIIALPAVATPDPDGTTWSVGEQVEVLWNGAWYKARIIEIHNGLYKVNYHGYNSSWDEYVDSERIRGMQQNWVN